MRKGYGEIQDMVSNANVVMSGMKLRMWMDEVLVNLNTHIRPKEMTGTGVKTKVFTTNRPRTYAHKMAAMLSGARLIVQTQRRGGDPQTRAIEKMGEEFFLGMLYDAERRNRLGVVAPPLWDQLVWYALVRGVICGLHVLVRRPDGTPEPQLVPWDPMHTFWNVRDGVLEWACRVHRTDWSGLDDEADDIALTGSIPSETINDRRTFEVYEYFDREHTTIVAPNKVIKPPTRHGLNRVPVSIIPIGPQPLMTSAAMPLSLPNLGGEGRDIQTIAVGYDSYANFGQSIFTEVRETYWQFNEFMSNLLEMVDRQVLPPMKERAAMNQQTNSTDPSTPHPYTKGYITRVELNQGDLEPLETPKTTLDWAMLLSELDGEIQRGTLPHAVYGSELGKEVSGYNRKLMADSADGRLAPYVAALQSFMRNCEETWRVQYSQVGDEGFHDFLPTQVEGVRHNRRTFAAMVTPNEVGMVGSPVIRIDAGLAYEDPAKITIIQQLREGHNPLIDDGTAREMLNLFDPDTVEELIIMQQAKRMIPSAALTEMMRSAQENGRPDLAQIYQQELMKYQMQMMPEQERFSGGGRGPANRAQGRPQQPGPQGGDPRTGQAPASMGPPPEPDERNTMGGRPEGS